MAPMSTVHVPSANQRWTGPAGPRPRPAFPAAAIDPAAAIAQAAHHPYTHFDALTLLGAPAVFLACIARYRSGIGYEIAAEVCGSPARHVEQLKIRER